MSSALTLRFGNLTIDLENYRVLLATHPVILQYRDYALLVYLASRPGRLVRKRQLLEEGLGRHDPGGLRAVDEKKSADCRLEKSEIDHPQAKITIDLRSVGDILRRRSSRGRFEALESTPV